MTAQLHHRTTVRLRPVLTSLPAYRPGRAVAGAVKLASNETPYPPLPFVVERIAAAAAGANRYPDTHASTLSAALAERFGVDPGQVVVGCGSVSLCAQLVQSLTDAGDEVLYAWRSFEVYPILVAVHGARSVQVPLRRYTHDLDAMADQITERTRLILVCNPNNPTGTVVDRDALRAFLRRVPEHIVVALDEAYREFVSDPETPDGMTLLGGHPNLVVLRTFSKAYGLAGLRVGYAVASDPAVAAALRKTQVPFAVTTVAQEAALASLEPQAAEQLLRRVGEVAAERERVCTALHGMGYDVPPSQGNFVWLPLGEATAAWASACESLGVVVRPFAGEGARVSIGTPEENDRFLVAASRARRPDSIHSAVEEDAL